MVKLSKSVINEKRNHSQVKRKYVIVSGRSSHTVTARSRTEAKKKFKKLFPYAEVRFVSPVG